MFALFSTVHQRFIINSRNYSTVCTNDGRRKLISAYDRLLDKLHNSNIPANTHYRKCLAELLTERKNTLSENNKETLDIETEHERLKDEENVLKMMEEEKPWETQINK